MAEITPFKVGLAGGKPTFAAAAAGDTAKCGAGYKLIVRNGSGSDITVTIADPRILETGLPAPDKTYTVVATTGEQWIPLYDFYADPSDGLAHITYSSTTTVTRAVVKG
jgi:hypothetical protein